MQVADSSRADFLTRVLTSSFPNTTAKRFQFEDGEVGAVYTMGFDQQSKLPHPVVLFVASFPPSYQGTTHHFGLVFTEKSVADAGEAASLLEQFTQPEAASYRASCLP